MDSSANQPENSRETSPDIIGSRYRIIREIGRGASSVVLEAEEKLLERTVALKLLNCKDESKDAYKRFLIEAKVSSSLQHQNIVQIYSFGITENDQPYIAMEFIKGRTLRETLEEERILNRDRFAEIFLPVLDALAFAHSKNVIHRDVKPSNMMLTQLDGTNTVKLLDFGISKFTDSNQKLTATAAVLGTPTYMSPEQCAGKKLDGRSDLYSLACVMYEALSGNPPFSGQTSAQIMYAQAHNEVPLLQDISGSRQVPKDLVSAIMKALSKEPDKRQASVDVFKEQIKAALQSKKFIQKTQPIAPGKLVTGVLMAVLFLSLLSFGLLKKSAAQKSTETGKRDITAAKDRRNARNSKEISVTIKNASDERKKGNPQKSLEILKAIYEDVHPDYQKYIAYHHDVGLTYEMLGNYPEAEKEYAIVLNAPKRNAEFSNDRALHAQRQFFFGRTLFFQKKYKQALDPLKSANEYYEPNEPANLDAMGTADLLKQTLLALNEPAAAKQLEVKIESKFKSDSPETNDSYKTALNNHIDSFWILNDMNGSIVFCKKMLKHSDSKEGWSEVRDLLRSRIKAANAQIQSSAHK